nr:uncharacterized protein LOC111423156 [Onthophagus taurus]
MEHHRLTSLTMKRDLSLGASKPKKIYKPNLNVVRNKDKSKEMIKLVQEQVKQKRDRHANRQNFRKEQPKNIQVSGVFSQGFGSGERRQTSGFERRDYTRDVDTQSETPKIKKKWTWENTDDEKMDYDPLVNKDDDTSEEEGEYQPIRLPLHANNGKYIQVSYWYPSGR